MEDSVEAPDGLAEAEADEPVSFSQMPICLFIRGLVLALAAAALLFALHYYVGARLFDGLTGWGGGLAWAALWLLFASIPLGFASTRFRSERLAVAVQWVSHVWMGLFALTLCAAAATDVAFWLLDRALGLDARWAQGGAIAALVAPSFGVGFRVARGRPRLERVRVRIAGLPEAFRGLRIVQLSDLHIGPTLRRDFLERVVEQVNALEPDVVAITGDLVDGSVSALADEVAPLSKLSARHGAYFVTGNHEYYHGGSAWEAQVRRLGVTVLHNQHVVLEKDGQKLVIGGVTDYDGGQFGEAHRARVDLAFEGAPEGAVRILLAHQPRQAKAAAEHGVSLQLSGHTHGGQLFPWMFFVRLQQPVISGLATLYGVQVYTSRGTGYWGPPVRLGPSSEVTELTLD